MSAEFGDKNRRGWFKDPDAPPSGRSTKDDGGLFGWTVIILVFIGIAVACWIGSFYIFGHPEKPLSHQVLSRLKKIEPPRRFELTAAPRGEFLRAPELLERYGALKPRQLARTNETLIRNYIRNYKPADGLVPYVLGTFTILDSFELTGGDFFPSGVVAIAQSKENPDLLIEQVFCADKRVVPSLHRTLLTGLDLDLKRENELAAVVNVERLHDGRVKLTTVSILYPSYESAAADGTFSLEPPQELNVGAGLPVVDAARTREADAKHEHYRQRALLAKNKAQGAKPVDTVYAPQRLMRVEKPIAVEPSQADAAPVPAATPVELVAAATPASVEMEVRAAIPVEPLVAATPQPTPEVSPTPMLEPTPVEEQAPKAIAAASSGNWQVYQPGRMPRGRLLSAADLPAIAKKGTAGERIYLQGEFSVTASGGDRAVLRAPRRGFGTRTDKIRIIVQYPNGMSAPPDGASVTRDARRPFQVMDIRESTGGQINVYVREVTKP